jgi:hypothetical protein
MHPNGQMPAYEWNFSDVNPPVHAWAALRVYEIEQKFMVMLIEDFWSASFKSCCLTLPGG